ncbi:hypothetical protein HK097_010554 [Rhizophlyctis rosea]|uniref:Uncharacterized protein n=1 Tax=Rhizophlyctis rosea TaxID=64517 RepID=A0AAD5S9R0_9FUNG|nr:hypothetical protein HK097_010554 [Rhizophlyctis rosea]
MKVILNSLFASNRDVSRPTFRFRNGLRSRQVRVSSAVVPVSWYNINLLSNEIFFKEAGSLTLTARLTPGIYAGENLSEGIADALDSAGTQDYTVDHDPVTMKLNIKTTGGKPFTILGSSPAARVLGLNGDTVPGTNVTLPRPINLTGCKMILVSIQELTNGDTVVAGKENLNILDAIPISVDYGNVLTWSNEDPTFVNTTDQVISEMNVRLLDSETLEVLDLNGESFQMVLDVI